MEDVFSDIYKKLKKEINSFTNSVDGKTCLKNRNVEVLNAYTQSTSKFPLITIEEKDNSFYSAELDDPETFSKLMYHINIYDNSLSSRVETVTKLSLVVDSVLSKHFNFRRTRSEPIQNINDKTIFRKICVYEAVINNHTKKINKY